MNIKTTKRKKRQQKKLLGLLILTGLSVTVLVVGTYAWFIGTNKVFVNGIELEVQAGDDLKISLDGETWANEITIDMTKITTPKSSSGQSYTGNTNHLPGEDGLQPISTAGHADDTVGRLKLFGKTSLTATAGGFRLMSTRIDNYTITGSGATAVTTDEKDGYFVFDVFIKNGKEKNYIPEYDLDNEEAIYLTRASKAQISTNGGVTPGYGLENSVRVAFMQIGRVSNQNAAADDSDTQTAEETAAITGINCTEYTTGGTITQYTNTGTCVNEKVAIWEPNDTNHDSELVDFFAGICKKRDASTGAYDTASCNPIVNGTAYSTYVVNQNIVSSDKIDVYDGLNGYTPSKLNVFNTYTDTMKDVQGNQRESIFSLAPNSVTKIRIYVYLEGQDVDNYDLITRGQKIAVNFGLTKDKYDMDTDDNPSS